MTNDKFDKVVEEVFASCKLILGSKGMDYPPDKEDRLSNFKVAGHRAGVTTLQAWLVYFMKHVECIEKYARGEYHDSEPISGRIADAINYLVILQAIIREEKEVSSYDQDQ